MTRQWDEGLERKQDLKYLLDRLDRHIKTEFELIGQRMNVLAVSQAFLFTAFTTDLLVSDRFVILRRVLLWMIPILGTAICVIVGMALSAAENVIRARKLEREVIRDRLREDLVSTTVCSEVFRARRVEILEHVSPRSLPDWFGNSPQIWLAPIIGLCWVILMIFVCASPIH